MPIRGDLPPVDEQSELLEHLRKGTREQYQSGWVSVAASATAALTHELGEMPWVVDVVRADADGGYNAVEVPATDITVAKTATTITITNAAADTYYFQVRAM